ncbi:hypothetical protein AAFF_G00035650 [Aldrovandia affinis]|uniref:Uncharacterized protein n=1 Tax=Aldrovandia affinis TaxID=143900 RepID=A0AAD7S350_9TELE|nr:hypothetical protein AAFF_G00035650 [Aldrovandia affinis]
MADLFAARLSAETAGVGAAENEGSAPRGSQARGCSSPTSTLGCPQRLIDTIPDSGSTDRPGPASLHQRRMWRRSRCYITNPGEERKSIKCGVKGKQQFQK